MTAEKFMENVRHAGGDVWAAGDKLRYRLPPGATGLVPAMRELKPELLQLLKPRNPDCWLAWDAETDALLVVSRGAARTRQARAREVFQHSTRRPKEKR
jgi:hypothetical protein